MWKSLLSVDQESTVTGYCMENFAFFFKRMFKKFPSVYLEAAY